jgi:hypothetical protein
MEGFIGYEKLIRNMQKENAGPNLQNPLEKRTFVLYNKTEK